MSAEFDYFGVEFDPSMMEAYLGAFLAVGALASMVFWPLYRLVKGVRQRGRLPDMKRKRVMVSAALVAVLVGAFFFLLLGAAVLEITISIGSTLAM